MYVQRQHRGQALVETALTIGIILMVIIHGINLIQWLGIQYGVQQAAKAAASAAALYGESFRSTYPLGGDVRLSTEPSFRSPSQDAAYFVLRGSPFTKPEYAVISAACQPNGASAPSPDAICRRYDPLMITITYEAPAWVSTPLIYSFTATTKTVAIYEHDPLPYR